MLLVIAVDKRELSACSARKYDAHSLLFLLK